MSKIDILSLEFDKLKKILIDNGQEKFRAKQIFSWLHDKKVTSFSEMSNLSAQTRQWLFDNFYINPLKISKKLVSDIDSTIKYLYELEDGEFVETVVMKYKHGNSICISSQVGCKMGCTFCASTKAGFLRNLQTSEMLLQIYESEKDLGEKVSNVVLMGIGEPLDNYDNLLSFLKIVSDENGKNLSLRNIAVSTCGLVDKIDKLAKEKLPITLSISLHAPNDEVRLKTMPINKKFCMDELLGACRRYLKSTNRRITFEYACIAGENDSVEFANELASKIKDMLCHVNLIPVNSIKESDFKPTKDIAVRKFSKQLEKHGIPVTIRRTLGKDINAACGQLRREIIKEKGKGAIH